MNAVEWIWNGHCLDFVHRNIVLDISVWSAVTQRSSKPTTKPTESERGGEGEGRRERIKKRKLYAHA